MALDSVLPGRQQCIIILLLTLDASLVLNLGQFGSPLFIHAILQVTAHSAISLTHLAKHISLVSLLVDGFLKSTLFMHAVLTVNLGVNLVLIVLSKPFLLFFHGLLEKDILLAILVNVLKQVDSGLVFTSPLLLTVVPLLFVLFLSQLINASFISCLVVLNIIVMLLELLDFSPAG